MDRDGAGPPGSAVVPALLTDARMVTVATDVDAGTLLEFSEVQDETVLQFKGNKKWVAEHLGISRSYLYKKLDVAEQNDARE